MNLRFPNRCAAWATMLCLLIWLAGEAEAARKGKGKKRKGDEPDPSYADLVWPPPPDEARIQLESVLSGRGDVEARSRMRRILLGASPQSAYDQLRKPFAVAFDSRGRILVTDWGNASLVRFDRREGRYDVLGTKGNLTLRQPLGLTVGPDDSIYVADVGLQRIVKLGAKGRIAGVYGSAGELTNPTDVELSPDGQRLYVCDSKAHRVVVFDVASAELVSSFGERGADEGTFHFPTSLAFDGDGNLLVVDQMNARVQLLAPDGEYLDEFGGRGVGFGNFSRPKDIAVDDAGFIYVTDNAFNNLQVFDTDFTLLTFIGETGPDPGRFWGASGVAVHGDHFAVVDQIGARVQVFRYLQARDVPVAGAVVASAERRPRVERPTPPPLVPPAPQPQELERPTPESQAPEPNVPEPQSPSTTIVPEPAVDDSTLPGEPEPDAESPSPHPIGEVGEETASEPAVPPAAPEPVAVEAPVPADEIAAVIEIWRSAWASQRVEDYLASYAADFRPADGLSRSVWEAQRRTRLSRPGFIEVEVEGLEIDLQSPEAAAATFVQRYRSNTYSDLVRKTLRLARVDGAWRIVAETSREP